jgi:hypothetical protein
MENWQKILVAILVSAVVGFAFGKYALPGKVQIKTQEVEKIVTVVQHDTVTETHEVKRPDGTVITDTTIKDRDTANTSTVDTKKSSETITNQKPQWKVQGLVGLSTKDLGQPAYGVGVERRIIGPIFVGAWGLSKSTEQTAGLSVSLEF